jgi:two-component system CheB/CheR fusion protein
LSEEKTIVKEAFSHVVVVGSSAGGVEALSELVSALPEDLGVPVILAQHLDPKRESHLEEILERHSTLPVQTVTDNEPLRGGIVYVVPANRHVNVTDHEIDLRVDSKGGPKPSVDLLMSSAAEVYGERLVAVILTGLGSDGAEGARAVRKAGGTVVVQNPETAKFSGMPGSIAPTTVDIVSDLDGIGRILHDLISGIGSSEMEPSADENETLAGFLEELYERYGVDFRSYKKPTILRRLRRRMAATGLMDIEGYAAYLWEHPEEYRHLLNAFLIKVTEFFRDPELFEYLREEVLPKLVEEARRDGRQLRVWSAGCATGEEAYSLAILVFEVLGEEVGQFDVRIFATDVDEDAVAFARHGIYPASALSGLSEEKIGRYFDRLDDGRYQVKKLVRSVVVFGEHDLARRSPFSRIDMTVSRNVLIYFAPELQRRALQLFAYSLRDGGYLVLGKSETVTPLGEFFESEQRQLKVYRRVGERFLMPPSLQAATPAPRPRRSQEHATFPVPAEPPPGARRQARASRDVDELYLNRLPVGALVVDRRYDILAINGEARRLLSVHGVAVGEDLLHLLREAPYDDVRSAIDAALRDGATARTSVFGLEDPAAGEARFIRLDCYPLRERGEGGLAERAMILVNDVTEEERGRRDLEERLESARAELERFRRETEADLAHRETQTARLIETNRQLEEANRELTALNEELHGAYEGALLSTEEAQAASEEVETLNEELQATNEELETLNEELQATIEELNTTNDDLQARTAELQEMARSNQEEQGRLRAILENIPEAVLVINAAGRTALNNAAYAELFGETNFEALDDLGNDLPPGETPQSRVSEGEPFTLEFTATKQDGTLGRFVADGRPIEGGEMGGVILVREQPDEGQGA